MATLFVNTRRQHAMHSKISRFPYVKFIWNIYAHTWTYVLHTKAVYCIWWISFIDKIYGFRLFCVFFSFLNHQRLKWVPSIWGVSMSCGIRVMASTHNAETEKDHLIMHNHLDFHLTCLSAVYWVVKFSFYDQFWFGSWRSNVLTADIDKKKQLISFNPKT